ncbi:hypothetical protein ACJRO7_010634 [Eucalyptus globulus]|uniref:Uncharacterized protein n=1 Tax=Eucalyptus globulus TaxID=34317 RepID=A0ABD3LCI8_EUCGL
MDRPLQRADRSWVDPRSCGIGPCTVRIDLGSIGSIHAPCGSIVDRSPVDPGRAGSVPAPCGSIPVERDRSLHRADRSRSSGIGPCTVRIDPRSSVIGPGRGPRPCGSSGIDRGRGPRSCGSVHAPCGSIMDRSRSRASAVRIDHGSIMVVWIDPCTVRIDHGSIPVERDRSWPTASAVWIDPIGAWIDHGSVPVERGSIPAPCGSIVDRSRSTGIGRGRPPRPCGSIRSVHG